MTKSKRRYEPENPVALVDWMELIGSRYTIWGVVFGGGDDLNVALLPGVASGNLSLWRPSLEQWKVMLKRSDDPLIYQQDETDSLKAWIRKAEYIISGEVQQRIWARDWFRCMYCGVEMGQRLLTVDHFEPLELGGANDPTNYVTACRGCNKRKSARPPKEWCEEIEIDFYLLQGYVLGHVTRHEYQERRGWDE